MKRSTASWTIRWASTVAVALGATSLAAADETIVLRSGTVNGVPGQPGFVDDNITCISNEACCVPFMDQGFCAIDFCAAEYGRSAVLVEPHALWLESLSADPDARWIHSSYQRKGNGGQPPASALYAIPFVVQTPGMPFGTIELTWAVDGRLGDKEGEPNQVGAYLNGKPLGRSMRSASWRYGNWNVEDAALQPNVQFKSGRNWLYLYQRDVGTGRSGIVFSANIVVDDCTSLSFTYCRNTPNSTGMTADLAVDGSLSVAANDTSIVLTGCPPASYAVLVYGSCPTNYAFGDGYLCVSPLDMSYLPPPVLTPPFGGSPCVFDLDFRSLPPGGEITGGMTRYFQVIYRDPLRRGGTTFNLSNGLGVEFYH